MPSSVGGRLETTAQFLNQKQRVPCNWDKKIPTSTHRSSKSVRDLSRNPNYKISFEDVYRTKINNHSHTPEAVLDMYVKEFGQEQLGNLTVSQYHYNEAGTSFSAAVNDYLGVIQCVNAFMAPDAPYRLELHPEYNPRPSKPEGGTGEGEPVEMDWNIFLVPRDEAAGQPISAKQPLQLAGKDKIGTKNLLVLLAGIEAKKRGTNADYGAALEWRISEDGLITGTKSKIVLAQARAYAHRYNCPYIFIDDYDRPISLKLSDYRASSQSTAADACPRTIKMQRSDSDAWPGFRRALAACLASQLYEMGLLRDMCVTNLKLMLHRANRPNDDVHALINTCMSRGLPYQQPWNFFLRELSINNCSQTQLVHILQATNDLSGAPVDHLAEMLGQKYPAFVQVPLQLLTNIDKSVVYARLCQNPRHFDDTRKSQRSFASEARQLVTLRLRRMAERRDANATGPQQHAAKTKVNELSQKQDQEFWQKAADMLRS